MAMAVMGAVAFVVAVTVAGEAIAEGITDYFS
jgi:hypothetical protein